MNDAIAFDTHRYVKRLVGCGFSQDQAETLADEQIALLNSNLATKSDIARIEAGIETFRQETKSDIKALRLATQSDIETFRQETKSDIEALRLATQSDIETLRQETKSDIESLRLATKSDIARVEAGIETLRQETKSDIESLRLATKSDIARVEAGIETLRQETKSDMANLKADLLKWGFAAMVAQTSVMAALFALFLGLPAS